MSGLYRVVQTASMASQAGAVPGFCLGFAMGGFFDGILLHQILQWHNLLSGVDSAVLSFRDQVLFDGLFHALMYVILAFGLGLLWSRRHWLAKDESGTLLSASLVGFGAWHILDAVVSHWLLGIHRIRPDSANPLFWDILFLALGVITLAAGSVRLRAPRYAALLLFAGVTGLAAASAVPWRASDTVTVVFRPDVSSAEVMQAALSVDAGIVGANTAGNVWTLRVPDARQAWRLYGHGAWFVSGTVGGMGCFTTP